LHSTDVGYLTFIKQAITVLLVKSASAVHCCVVCSWIL